MQIARDVQGTGDVSPGEAQVAGAVAMYWTASGVLTSIVATGSAGPAELPSYAVTATGESGPNRVEKTSAIFIESPSAHALVV